MATNQNDDDSISNPLSKAFEEAKILPPLDILEELEGIKSLIADLVLEEGEAAEALPSLNIEALRKARNEREEALVAFEAARVNKNLVSKETKEMETKLWLLSKRACPQALAGAKKNVQRIRAASFDALKEAQSRLDKANSQLQQVSGDVDEVVQLIQAIQPGRNCWNELKEAKEVVFMVAFRDPTVKKTLWAEYNAKKEELDAAKKEYDANRTQTPRQSQQASQKPELTPAELEERREKSRQKSARHAQNKARRAAENRENAKGGSGGGKKGKK